MYRALTKICTAMDAEKGSYVGDEEETNPLFEISKLWPNCFTSWTGYVLMLFVGDKKRVKSMLKDNARAFSDPENILFGPKYEKMVAKFLSSKNISKGLFGSIKYQGSSKEENRMQPFRKGPLFRTIENRGWVMFTAADQTLQQQYPTGGQRMSLLIAPSITSYTDLLSPSEFCKIHALIVNLFPVKVKQLPSASIVKHL